MASLVVVLWLAAVAVTDLRTMRIPNALVWPGICAVAATAGADPGVAAAALMAAAPYVMCRLVGWCGGGDVKLAMVCGALVARWDLAVLLVSIAALLSAAAFAVVHHRKALPHGPALVAATVALALLVAR